MTAVVEQHDCTITKRRKLRKDPVWIPFGTSVLSHTLPWKCMRALTRRHLGSPPKTAPYSTRPLLRGIQPNTCFLLFFRALTKEAEADASTDADGGKGGTGTRTLQRSNRIQTGSIEQGHLARHKVVLRRYQCGMLALEDQLYVQGTFSITNWYMLEL